MDIIWCSLRPMLKRRAEAALPPFPNTVRKIFSLGEIAFRLAFTCRISCIANGYLALTLPCGLPSPAERERE